jgi:transcriptional regulator with XRE-family HTH domain
MLREMKRDLKRQIGRQIAKARLGRGYTQERLAELTGRSVEAISNLERGKSFPSVETLEGLSQSLGVPLRELFDDRADRLDRRTRRELKGRALLHALSDDLLDVAPDQLKALAKHESALERRRRRA